MATNSAGSGDFSDFVLRAVDRAQRGDSNQSKLAHSWGVAEETLRGWIRAEPRWFTTLGRILRRATADDYIDLADLLLVGRALLSLRADAPGDTVRPGEAMHRTIGVMKSATQVLIEVEQAVEDRVIAADEAVRIRQLTSRTRLALDELDLIITRAALRPALSPGPGPSPAPTPTPAVNGACAAPRSERSSR